MKKILFTFLIIISSLTLFAENYALFDSKGTQLTDFEYEQIHPFFNDLALCKKNDKFGYLNTQGKVSIPFLYNYGEYFYKNTTKVSKNNNYIYINKENKPIFTNEYQAYIPKMSNIIESYNSKSDFDYLVVKHKGLCGAADRNGNIVIPCEYERIFNCDDNIFLVSKNNLFGYINRNNQIIIPFEYERASLFNYGFAIVTKKGSAFVINSQGNLIAKDCDEYYIYSNNLILCSKNNKIGAFDSEGKQIIAFEYSLNTNENNKYIKHNLMTKENGCFILYKGGKYFLFNNKGTGINNIKTNDIKDYYSEYTVVSSGKYAVDIFGRLEFNTLNEAKKYVDSLKVKMVTELPNKYSLIKPEISCHILDRNWKEVLTPAFENIKDFKNNTFAAKQNNKYGITDTNNKVIIPFEYEDLGNFFADVAIAKQNNKYGLINKENKSLCDFSYTLIKPFIKDFAVCEKDGKFGVINSMGKEILQPIYSEVKIYPKELEDSKEIFFIVKE